MDPIGTVDPTRAANMAISGTEPPHTHPPARSHGSAWRAQGPAETSAVERCPLLAAQVQFPHSEPMCLAMQKPIQDLNRSGVSPPRVSATPTQHQSTTHLHKAVAVVAEVGAEEVLLFFSSSLRLYDLKEVVGELTR